MNKTYKDRLGVRYPQFRDQFYVLDFDEERKFPTISLFPVPEELPKEQATLTATNLEGKSRSSTWKELEESLSNVKEESPIICQIFNWAEVIDWEGWKLKDTLNHLEIDGEENNYYAFHSRDGKYFETLTHEEAMDDRSLLVYGMNGEDLSQEHGGPLRIIVPFLQGYKSVKWVDKISCSEEDPEGIKRILGQSRTAKLSDKLLIKYDLVIK